MQIHGAYFVAATELLKQRVGETAFANAVGAAAKQFPILSEKPSPSVAMPIDAYCALHDAIIAESFRNDRQAFVEFGAISGQFALTEGSLKGYFPRGDFKKFFQFLPALWKAYFTAGRTEVKLEGDQRAEMSAVDLPFQHPYLELSTVGFVTGGLRAIGASNPRMEKLKTTAREVAFAYRISVD
jgi:hypothetical protein